MHVIPALFLQGYGCQDKPSNTIAALLKAAVAKVRMQICKQA